MKKIYVLLVALLTTCAVSAQKNIIKTSPLGYVYGKYNLQYERMLSDYSSVNVSASYIQPNLFGFEEELTTFLADKFDTEWNLNGYAISADYRLYTKKESGPRGFYVAPYLRYTNIGFVVRTTVDINLIDENGEVATIDYLKTGISILRYGYGVKIGAQWLIADRVSVDWNFGGIGADMYQTAIYGKSQVRYKGEIIPIQETDISYKWRYAFAMNFTLGYAF